MKPIIDKKPAYSIAKFTKLKKNKRPIQKLFDFDQSIKKRFCTCGNTIQIETREHQETNQKKSSVTQAHTCQLRYCNMCNYYKVRSLSSQMTNVFMGFDAEKYKGIFLTLTTKNCEYSELRKSISHMNKSWIKLVERLYYRGSGDWLKGWIRSTEVTFNGNNCHPHFHIILFVTDDYFKKQNYILNKGYKPEWSYLWRDCLQADYMPVVDIKKTHKKNLNTSAVQSSISELQKYCIKATDLRKIKTSENMAIVYNQFKGLRFLATSQNIKLNEKEKVFDSKIWDLIKLEIFKWHKELADYKLFEVRDDIRKSDYKTTVKEHVLSKNKKLKKLLLSSKNETV
tara:strand:- start:1673 stop:2695 length:1023 start_codon:yes stop_codon:yes gene_type:complete